MQHHTEREDSWNSDEVEISDLPSSGDGSHQGQRARYSLLAWGLQDPYKTLRRWRWPITLLTGLAAVVLLLVLLSQTLAGLWLLLPNATTTPSVLFSSHQDLFYFPSLPTWGTFSLDGRPLAYAPTRSNEVPLRLPYGTHHLTWHAAPFSLQSCTFSVPPGSQGQSCIIQSMQLTSSVAASFVFKLRFPVALSLKQLPFAQQAALVSAAQTLLDTLQAAETVQSGEWYGNSLHTASLKQAIEPLSAQVRFLLVTDTSTPANCQGVRLGQGCSMQGTDCRLFCTIDWPENRDDPAASHEWSVAAIMQPSWNYARTRGDGQPGVRGPQEYVMFRISWEHDQWHVSFHDHSASTFEDPGCITTAGMLLAHSGYPPIQKQQQELTWTFFSGANRAAGCVARTSVLGPIGLSSTPFSDALFLQRFGVLLAANESAHLLWPTLSRTSASEQSIANEIVAHAAFES